MPRRKIPILTGRYYHLYNQSLDGENAFTHKYHYQKAIEGLWYYRYHRPPIRLAYFKSLNQSSAQAYLDNLKNHPLLVDIIAYVLLNDHFHLIVRQNIDGGTSRFMANMQNSYTRYFNAHKGRTGMLFERQFKAIPIENDYDKVLLSKYLHLKPIQEKRVQSFAELVDYDWSSLPEYLETKPEHLRFCYREPILEHFDNPHSYRHLLESSTMTPEELNVINYLLSPIEPASPKPDFNPSFNSTL